MKEKIGRIVGKIAFILFLAAVVFLSGVFVYTHYIEPKKLAESERLLNETAEPEKTWLDAFKPKPKKSEEIPEIDATKLKPGSCLVFEEKYCDKGRSILPVGVSGESNGFVVGWNVPVGTVIFAPFEGRVTQTTLSPPDGSAKLMGVEVFQSSTGDWVKATLRFSAIAHNLELLVEKGTEVKPGDPIAKVTSSKIIEAVDVAKYGNFSLLLHFSTTDLSDQRFYEWYDLLVGK